MLSLYLTTFFWLLGFSAADQAVTTPAQQATQCASAAPASNLIFQSTDGGETWRDISDGLPGAEQVDAFFAGESELYLRAKNGIYESRSKLATPVWEEVKGLDLQTSSIAFNRSGVIAFNYDGQMVRKTPVAQTWLPVYPAIKRSTMRTIFETADGKLLFGCDDGLFRSADNGKTWTQVHNEGWVITIVGSEGVLLATGQKGIMRSTDRGVTWEWVISQGGVGIAIEKIDGGFAAIVFNTSTLSRKVLISLDQGKGASWRSIDAGLEPSMHISSIKQVGNYLLCSHPEGVFRSADLGKTWHNVLANSRANGSFKTPGLTWKNGRLFTLHTSGNVAYAVLRDAGC